MPIPKPKKGESKKDFTSRCMSNSVMLKEYPDEKQRMAVCSTSFASNSDQTVSNFQTNMSKLIREETFENRRFLVAPVVLIKEGVANNVLYTAEELSKFAQAWNGEPVTIWHPVTNDGKPASANSPQKMQEHKIGIIFNTYFEAEKLKGEAWLDVDKLNDLGSDVLNYLKSNKNIEVSTGMFQEEVPESGEWNGVEYSAVAQNIRPDHLALLPGGKGACSWEDGAGLPRINQQEELTVLQKMKNLLSKGIEMLAPEKIRENKELSFSETEVKLRDAITEKLNTTDYIWLSAVFDKYFIYSIDGSSGTSYYKQSYSIIDDVVELINDPEQVERVVKFEPVTENRKQENTGDSKMDREKAIESLIANSNWTEDDTEFLKGLEDGAFDKIVANSVEKKEEPKVPETSKESETPAANQDESKEPETSVANQEDEPVTVEAYVSNAPEAIQEILTDSLATHQAQKAELVKALTENSRNKFTEDELKVKKLSELQKLADLARVDVDFSGRAVGEPAVNQDTDEIGPMPTINWNE